MEFFEFLFAGVVAFAIKVVPKIIRNTAEIIMDELRQIFPEQSRTYQESRKTVRVTAEEISEIDKEIQDREDSLSKGDNKADRQKIDELNREKKEAHEKYQEAQGQCIRNQYEEDPNKFEKSELVKGNENRLLYHTGLIQLKKKCPSCGSVMRLMHKTVENPNYSHFFWQCTGYYAGNKCKTLSFRPSDIDLLNRNDINELMVDNQTITRIAKKEKENIEKRLKSHLEEKDVDVICPVHLTAMTLREKQRPDDMPLDMPLLDKYHLKCTHKDCSQTTKLKSFPQLAAYLNRAEGKGILI
jgi:phage FluMu protein Com